MLCLQSIVFVVDSADAMRMVVAKDELEAMLQHADVQQRAIPILIFANKSDKQDALAAVEIMSLLELQNIKNHAWHIQCVALRSFPRFRQQTLSYFRRASNALTGEGVEEGVEWLAEKVTAAAKAPGAAAGAAGSS